MVEFLRPELAALTAYVPHPGGAADGRGPIDRLDTNESPYDLPPSLKGKLARAIEAEIEANRYPDGAQTALKIAITGYINESCIAIANGTSPAITPDQLSIGNGSDELIRALLIATCLGDSPPAGLRQRGRILVAEPTFGMYAILAETLGIPVTRIGRSPKTFEMDVAAGRAALADPSAPPVRVIWVVHPNSPTANALSAAELSWLRGIPKQTLVVIDEAYFEFSQRTVVGELHQRPNWVVLRTFSKAFRLAAHRVGYAIAPPAVASALEKIRLPYNLPALSQVAARVVLEHRRDLLMVVGEILRERERLLARLRALPGLDVWDSQANFVYVRPKTDDPGEATLAEWTSQLKAQGTLVRHTGGGLRITVGQPPENDRTIDHLAAILGA